MMPSAAPRRSPTPPRGPSRRLRRKRTNAKDPLVLIVEDDEDSREGYASYFRYQGVRVVTAVDGREALDLAARLSPDVIVMDLGMPRMDGWTAIRQLRTRARTRDVRILALTAHCAYEEERLAWHSGTDAFRAKPCIPDDLLREIRLLLARPSGGSGGAMGEGGRSRSTGSSVSRRRRTLDPGPSGPLPRATTRRSRRS